MPCLFASKFVTKETHAERCIDKRRPAIIQSFCEPVFFVETWKQCCPGRLLQCHMARSFAETRQWRRHSWWSITVAAPAPTELGLLVRFCCQWPSCRGNRLDLQLGWPQVSAEEGGPWSASFGTTEICSRHPTGNASNRNTDRASLKFHFCCGMVIPKAIEKRKLPPWNEKGLVRVRTPAKVRAEGFFAQGFFDVHAQLHGFCHHEVCSNWRQTAWARMTSGFTRPTHGPPKLRARRSRRTSVYPITSEWSVLPILDVSRRLCGAI